MEQIKSEQNGKRNTYLFSLLCLCLEQEKALDTVVLTQEEFDDLLKLAKRHGVHPMVAYALLSAGNLTDEQEQRCRMLAYRIAVSHERMEQALQKTCDLLENAGIAYMPLKGAVIRKFYPEPWLRTSGDIDILVQDVDRAAKILMENGYIKKGTHLHEVTLLSPGGVIIELHFQLIETDPRVNALLERVWDHAIPREGTCHYEMETEQFYYYHIAHMAKHMILGGCGIRFFVDTWLLNQKLPMDEEKKKQYLQEGGLWAFAQQAECLSKMWFGNHQPEPLLLELESFILNGGIFGSQSNIIKLRRTKADTTVSFLFRRFFPPYRQMCQLYPVLKKYPVLLPVFWGKRWIERLMNRSKILSAVQELELNKNLDKNTVLATKRLFQNLELL